MLTLQKISTALIFLVVILINCSFAQEEQRISSKKRVAVIDFDNNSSFYQANIGEVASNYIVEQLLKAGYFEVIERQKLANILKEQSIAQTGFIDPESAAQIGKILGIDIMVMGSIQQAEVIVERSSYFDKKKNVTNYYINTKGEVAVNLKVVDINTAEIKLAKTEKDTSYDSIRTDEKYSAEKNVNRSALINKALQVAISKFLDDFERLYSLTGYALEKNESEGTVVVNLGTKDGVVKGMYFTLFETKKYAVAGKEYESIGKKQCNLKIIDVFEDIAIAQVTGKHYKETVKRIVIPSKVQSVPRIEGE